MNQAIFEATTLTQNELIRHRIGMEIQLAQELPVVRGDRVQLQQVLLNLIVNAIEAMSAVDEGPRELLIASAVNAADSVLVAVRDSGPGLTPDGFDRAFQAFQTTKPDGMGMGLSISRWIVEAHVDGYGPRPTRRAVLSFNSHCLRTGRARRDAAPLSPTR
jgi:C4-dicarboxylate-specific signal transduction histidine kinase